MHRYRYSRHNKIQGRIPNRYENDIVTFNHRTLGDVGKKLIENNRVNNIIRGVPIGQACLTRDPWLIFLRPIAININGQNKNF